MEINTHMFLYDDGKWKPEKHKKNHQREIR